MKKRNAILPVLALIGVGAASAQGVYTTNPYLDVPGSPYGIPVEFDIVGDAGPYYYGRVIPSGNVRTDEIGPVSRMGTVRSLNGTLTGGNMTRTGSPKFDKRAAVEADARYAASGVTGALSGSYTAGVGGVGGLADLGPRASFGAVAGQALAAGAEVVPINTPQQTATTPPLPTVTTQPGATTRPAETPGEYIGPRYTAPESASPVGRQTYTSTYEYGTRPSMRPVQRVYRTLEK